MEQKRTYERSAEVSFGYANSFFEYCENSWVILGCGPSTFKPVGSL